MDFKKKYALGFEWIPDVGPKTMDQLDKLCPTPTCNLACGPDQTLDPVQCVCNPKEPGPSQHHARLLPGPA